VDLLLMPMLQVHLLAIREQ